jgi:peptidylprolyl isomerase
MDKLRKGARRMRKSYCPKVKTFLVVLSMAFVLVCTTIAMGGEKVVTTASGLKYVDHQVGNGASPKKGDIVVVHYTGTLENGTKFDSSVDRGKPFEFPIGIGRVIKGWDEGVMTMKPGGKRKLMIPGNLAYGPEGVSHGGKQVIPPNATLIFEVELLEIKK